MAVPGTGPRARYPCAMPTIKKYENRRLYDTEASRYVNLDEVAAMVRRGDEVTVVDAKSGRDLTREVLLQIVLELQGGAELLPVPMLRRIIRATGDDPLQRVLRQQLALGLDLLHAQLDQVERQFARYYAPPPPSPVHTAQEPPPPAYEAGPRAGGDGPKPAADDDMDALRRRLSELEARLKR